MKNEVSVAELYVRDGWDEQVPPPSRSRLRVIAVMAAVVIGCGAAALLVRSGASVDHNAQQIGQIGIIEMPQRTAGIAGADATPDQVPTKGPDGAGRGVAAPVTETTGEPAQPDPSSRAAPTTIFPTAAPPEAPVTTPRADPPTGAPTTSQPPKPPAPPPPPPPTTSTPKPCFLLIFC